MCKCMCVCFVACCLGGDDDGDDDDAMSNIEETGRSGS